MRATQNDISELSRLKKKRDHEIINNSERKKLKKVEKTVQKQTKDIANLCGGCIILARVFLLMDAQHSRFAYSGM